MPEYKKEYPSLKRTQLIAMIQKEFKKSPENPVYRQQLMNVNKLEQNKNDYEENETDWKNLNMLWTIIIEFKEKILNRRIWLFLRFLIYDDIILFQFILF